MQNYRKVLACCLTAFALIQFNFMYFYRAASRRDIEELQQKIKAMDATMARITKENSALSKRSKPSSTYRSGRKFRDTFGPITPSKRRSRSKNQSPKNSGSNSQNSENVVRIAHSGEYVDRNQKPLTAERLLLSSHRGLLWYDVVSGAVEVLNENNGIYYGVFPSDIPGRLYVVSSRLNVKTFRTGQADSLLEIDQVSGEILSRKSIDSSFTHDTVLAPNKDKVFVADTASGSVLVLRFPSLEVFQRVKLFTRSQHINTLAPTDDGKLWVMLHNRGDSDMVLVDYVNSRVECTVKAVGKMAHGIVKLKENGDGSMHQYLLLSSREVKLVKVGVPAKCTRTVMASDSREVLWTYNAQEDTGDMFLKGLIVVDNVAYFGLSKFERTRLGRLRSKVSLVAFDLVNNEELWVRRNVGVFGLVNIIGAPQLGPTHTYRMNSFANATTKAVPKLGSYKRKAAEELSKCSKKYLETLANAKAAGTAFGTTGKDNLFIKLPLRFDVKALRRELGKLASRTSWTLRPDVNNHFILLVTKHGESTDQSNQGPFRPVAGRLESMPYTRKVLGSFKSVVGRSRYMNLTAHTNLVLHVDRTHHVARNRPNPLSGYWGRRFRVHIPLISDESVIFGVKDGEKHVGIHMEEGSAYLFNNANQHYVNNPTDRDRIHLIFDTVGSVDLHELITKSTVVRADGKEYPFTNADPASMNVDIPVTASGNEVSILYENWVDEAVFEPMPPEEIHRNLFEYILPLVPRANYVYTPLKALFVGFLRKWEKNCFVPLKAQPYSRDRMAQARNFQLTCKRLRNDLLTKVLELDICSTEGGVTLLSGDMEAEISLSTAVETVLRMAFYECVGWSRYSMFEMQGPKCLPGGRVPTPLARFGRRAT